MTSKASREQSEQVVREANRPSPIKKTTVIFRKFREGEVIALFPEEPGNHESWTCSSYVHVGGHGSADPFSVIARTRPASPEESATLLEELKRIGYNVVVRHRMSREMVEKRLREIRRINGVAERGRERLGKALSQIR